MSEIAKEVAKRLAVAALVSAVLACAFAAGFRAGWERGKADTIQAVMSLFRSFGGWKAETQAGARDS